MRLPRWGIRLELLLASVALVLAPLVVVWSVGLVEDLIHAHVEDEITDCSALLAQGADELELLREEPEGQRRWLQQSAEDHHVLIRLVDEEGRVVEQAGAREAERFASLRRWWMGLDDFFFGPPGPPDVLAFEATLPPLPEREEVRSALQGQRAGRWRYDPEARMMVYSVAAPLPEQGGVIYVSRVSRRVIRSLYEMRYQLLKLTLFMTGVALLVGLYFGRRFVTPLRRVQQRITSFLHAPRSQGEKPPSLALKRRDELGELSRAFQELTTRLHHQATDAAGLAADLTHDLKNPIATVTATAELLEGGKTLTAERQRRIATALSAAARHMNRSVDGLLELSKLDVTRNQVDQRPLDLAELVDDVVEELRNDPQYEGAKLELLLPEREVPLLGVGDPLEMLLRCLLENALAFCETTTRVELSLDRDVVTMTVSDDGPGVSLGNRDKIFRRFFTARPDGDDSGSGLGLAIAASIARSHGGELELLEEGPLPGACFQVTLRRGK